MKRSASLALVIQSLRPVSEKPVGGGRRRVSSARRRRCRTLLPTARTRPRWRSPACGRYRCLISSLPQRASALMTRVFWTSTSTLTDASTRARASTARTEWKKLAPPPPSDSGISMPMTPSAKSFSSRPGCKRAASSISRTCGAISRRANSSTLAWNRDSSSDSSVSADMRPILSKGSGLNGTDPVPLRPDPGRASRCPHEPTAVGDLDV